MSQKISISVPYNHLAISSAANMLTQLAEDLRGQEGHLAQSVDYPYLNSEGNPYLLAQNGEVVANSEAKVEDVAKAVFTVPVVADGSATFNDGIHTMENTYGSTAPVVPTPPAPAAPVTTATGVELDAAGFPWNPRIHASSKTKDAKGYWKYLRGVDREGLVPAIEAEMRAMMGTPVESPAELAGIASEGQADDEMMAGAVFNQSAYHEEGLSTPTPPPPPPAPDVPVAPTAPSGTVTTFAQLITGVTSKGIDEAKVNAALAAVGVSNIALLGARADLIPTVAGHLGL